MGLHPGKGRAGAAPGAPAIPQSDASPRQPRQECLLSPQPAAGKYFPRKKKASQCIPRHRLPTASVAVLFCRRRDTEPEEERRQRWESFKKLWLRLFHPLEKGLGSCKTARAAKHSEAAFGGEGGFPLASKSQLHIPGEAFWDIKGYLNLSFFKLRM